MGNTEAKKHRREMSMLETAGGTQWMNCQCIKNQQARCRVEDGSVREIGVRPGFKTDVGTSNVLAAGEPAFNSGFSYTHQYR